MITYYTAAEDHLIKRHLVRGMVKGWPGRDPAYDRATVYLHNWRQSRVQYTDHSIASEA